MWCTGRLEYNCTFGAFLSGLVHVLPRSFKCTHAARGGCHPPTLGHWCW